MYGDTNLEYERTGRSFDSVYPGYCAVDRDHKIRRGDRVSKIQRSDNPLLPVTGVACASCTKTLPHANG